MLQRKVLLLIFHTAPHPFLFFLHYPLRIFTEQETRLPPVLPWAYLLVLPEFQSHSQFSVFFHGNSLIASSESNQTYKITPKPCCRAISKFLTELWKFLDAPNWKALIRKPWPLSRTWMRSARGRFDSRVSHAWALAWTRRSDLIWSDQEWITGLSNILCSSASWTLQYTSLPYD